MWLYGKRQSEVLQLLLGIFYINRYRFQWSESNGFELDLFAVFHGYLHEVPDLVFFINFLGHHQTKSSFQYCWHCTSWAFGTLYSLRGILYLFLFSFRFDKKSFYLSIFGRILHIFNFRWIDSRLFNIIDALRIFSLLCLGFAERIAQWGIALHFRVDTDPIIGLPINQKHDDVEIYISHCFLIILLKLR